MQSLPLRILEFIRRHGLLSEGDGLVLGFSGGPDSVALALILTELSGEGRLPLKLLLAHLNHCLRGAESDHEEAFCQRFAERHGLSIEVERQDVESLAARTGLSFEAAARHARYDFLGRVAAKVGASAVATAHQADDVAETVLLRLIRGSGIRGLGGMAPCRPLGPRHAGVRLVRPLLELRKAELLGFLRARGEPFCTDSSNLDTSHARNKIRHELIPFLERGFPTFSVRSLCALSASALETSRLLDDLLAGLWGKLCTSAGPDGVALDRDALAEAPAPLRKAAAVRALEILTGDAGAPPALRAEQYERLAGLPFREVGAEVSLPKGFRARLEHGLVLFSRAASPLKLPVRELPVPGEVELPEVGMRIVARALSDGTVGPVEAAQRASDCQAFLSLRATEGPLQVRSRRPGDRFHPLGAPGAARLKKFLIHRHVPLHERDRTPLVAAADGEIAWVVGHEIGDRFKLRRRGEAVLHLTAQRTEPPPGREKSGAAPGRLPAR